MTYEETLDFIHSIPRFSKDKGLTKMENLLKRLGNPEKKLKFIHVAGTNGKGSTCSMLSHILTQAGYKTGLYISPFILKFNERIQVNGEMIEDQQLVYFTQLVKKEWDEMKKEGEPPSEFELVVAVALLYFVQQKCGIIVLETGMGGRLDSTNVIPPPLVSVITSISMEHTQILGDTLEKITREKADIIKTGSPVVSYGNQEPEVLAVLMERCAQTGSKLLIPHKGIVDKMDIFGSTIQYDGEKYQVFLAGPHQVWNTLTVLETCKVLDSAGFHLSYKDKFEGIKNTHFPSRMEILGEAPLLLLDGAHNLSGAIALQESLRLLQGRSIHLLMGMMSSKDVHGVIRELAPIVSKMTATKEPHFPGFVEPEELAAIMKQIHPNVVWSNDPTAALMAAYKDLGPDDVLVICGSLYLASYLRDTGLKLGGGRTHE